MTKSTISVSIDTDVLNAARKAGINISAAASDGIYGAIGCLGKKGRAKESLYDKLKEEDKETIEQAVTKGFIVVDAFGKRATIANPSLWLGSWLKNRGYKNIKPEQIDEIIERVREGI